MPGFSLTSRDPLQVLEIQACMPAPPSTKRRMMSGVYIAYAIVAWCYLGVGFSGYAAFGGLLSVPSADRLRSLPVTGLAPSHTVLGG